MLEFTQELTMAMVVTQQSTENMEYVRRLLKLKQPGFAAALELAVDLVERDLESPEMPCEISPGGSLMTSRRRPRNSTAARTSRR
jgi:hypothetical protein